MAAPIIPHIVIHLDGVRQLRLVASGETITAEVWDGASSEGIGGVMIRETPFHPAEWARAAQYAAGVVVGYLMKDFIQAAAFAEGVRESSLTLRPRGQ